MRRVDPIVAALVIVTAGGAAPAPCGEQFSKLVPADTLASDLFGWSVAIDGTMAVVGALLDDTGVTNAAGGLAAAWNALFPCGDFLYLSYRGTDGRVYVVSQPLTLTPMNVRLVEGDASVAQQDYVEDCEICCRPIDFSVSVSEDGAASVEARLQHE